MTGLKSKFRFFSFVVLSVFCVGLLGLALPGLSQAVVTVKGNHAGCKGKGNACTPETLVSYHWTLQEDVTFHVKPGTPRGPDVDANSDGDVTDEGDTDWNGNGENDPVNLPLAGTFHKSNIPVVASGTEGVSGVTTCAWYDTVSSCNDPALAIEHFQSANPSKHYFLSVLPVTGYNMGGVQIAPYQSNVTVNVNEFPLPTAQIAVWVFEDNQPINGAIDGGEVFLPGFEILLEEAGGKYGISAGQVLADAYGNPLGTEYLDNDPTTPVLPLGNGRIFTGPDGKLLIKNLAPAKYGIKVVAPLGEGWSQTSTIEGTKVIDAWVLANEPKFFTEFGPPGPHAFVGFVKPTNTMSALGTADIKGTVVNTHTSRQPDPKFHITDAFGHDNCWVGLNQVGMAAPYVAPCDKDAVTGENLNTFTIPEVPEGDYQLTVWSDFLTTIIASRNISVGDNPAVNTCPTSGVCNLGDVAVFNWFGRIENNAFFDSDKDGFWDDNEQNMGAEVATNIRFRDGTIYQSIPTDGGGAAPYDVVFPFFSWMVSEVDYGLALKPTGATFYVDAGGSVAPGELMNKQIQAGGLDYRTEAGAVVTQGTQTFLGQTNRIDWGKNVYDGNNPLDNGGISGMVLYGVTRAEADPSTGAAEPWEPGIPRVQVSLYKDADQNKLIDDLPDVDNAPFEWNIVGGTKGVEDIDRNGDGVFDLANGVVDAADVDNYPLGNFPGSEDVDNYNPGTLDLGDAIQVTYTDSWDDNLPTGCVKDGDQMDPAQPNFKINGNELDCYDGLRNFNQARPAVYDGGYIFEGISNGYYIVEAATPPGYILMKEEDQNVAFGAEFIVPELLPPECVGEDHLVPLETSLFPGEAAAYAGQDRKLCDRKRIRLAANNAAVDFFLWTPAPIAAHALGFQLNDLANEFDPRNPQFGEKHAPSFLPVAVRDWTGREVARVYSDEFGYYNLPLPSSFSANVPNPSGWSPAMYLACMNDAGPIGEGTSLTLDPNYDKQYSQFCYPMSFMPGSTTYLDTPVLPISAFTGQDLFPLDCECEEATPAIASVNGPTGLVGKGPLASLPSGSWVPFSDTATPDIVITSQGMVSVPNPRYAGKNDPSAEPKTILRDYSFGDVAGSVTLEKGGVKTILDGFTATTWNDGRILAEIPAGLGVGKYQLMVTRGDNAKTTKVGISFHITTDDSTVHHVFPDTENPFATPIQDALDRTTGGFKVVDDGELVIIHPGLYFENVVLHKKVDLQCSGAGSTFINVPNQVGSRKQDWLDNLYELFNLPTPAFNILPNQEVTNVGLTSLATEQGAGILVLGGSTDTEGWSIDGCGIFGASSGGGVIVNGFAPKGVISNNRISNNFGIFGGGIRAGTVASNGDGFVDAENDSLVIRHNQITQNGSAGLAAGAGVSLYTGTDGYQVNDNFVCGNFTQGNGAGIGHLGLSDGGAIVDNTIVFNQSFNQGQTRNGGGIFVGGMPSLVLGGVTPGSGSVVIDSNLIQGNNSGAGEGAGIRLEMVNGADAAEIATTHQIDIINNMIVNNIAGDAAGGISLQDSIAVNILHNTIANNDSTATVGGLFTAGSNTSTPQPAGIVSHVHSDPLLGLAASPMFSDPVLSNNIIWHNRSFSVMVDETVTPFVLSLVPAPGVYDDLGVQGTLGSLSPMNSVLTGAPLVADVFGNTGADPVFVSEYFNEDKTSAFIPEVTTNIAIQGAFDEGGNFIDIRFGPLSLTGDYHIDAGSSADGLGGSAGVTQDIDNDPRPALTPDSGADEN